MPKSKRTPGPADLWTAWPRRPSLILRPDVAPRSRRQHQQSEPKGLGRADPALESLAAQPESAQAEKEVRARNARVEAAKAERIPDVRVEVLYHRLEATKSDTLDVGLSVPLALFNRNQGRLRETQAEAVAAEARARMTQNELRARLRESHLQLAAALANSRTLKEDVLPRAETVLKGAEARYAAGDTSLAEVLPGRRDWAALQLSYLE